MNHQRDTLLQLLLIPEPNGPTTSTPSETREDVVHVGLSEPLRLSQTDLPSTQMEPLTSYSHLNNLYLATALITVAMVVT